MPGFDLVKILENYHSQEWEQILDPACAQHPGLGQNGFWTLPILE